MNTGYNILGYKDPRLARFKPTDFEHMGKYPLKLATVSKPTPVIVGVNWYESFDKPIKRKDGRFWVGEGPLGKLRGGHAIFMPTHNNDLFSWYKYYDQGMEGACVGFASSHAMSILNRKMYDARWLWNEAKKIDEWDDTNPGDDNGTSVRAALDVLRKQGHVMYKKGKIYVPYETEGIAANRWAENIDDVLEVLDNPLYKKLGAIPFTNSWGSSYPQKVWMPCRTWERLLEEDGEFAVITDR